MSATWEPTSLPALRALLKYVLVDDVDLRRLCIDYFPSVMRSLSQAMGFESQLSVLLTRVAPAQILAALEKEPDFRERLAQYHKPGSSIRARRPILRIGGGLGIGLILLLGSFSVWQFAGQKKGNIDFAGGDLGTGEMTNPKSTTKTKPPREMVAIPAARFRMGSTGQEVAAAFAECQRVHGNDCRREIYEREQPTREIELSAYLMDVKEVSYRDFAKWLGTVKDLRIDEKGLVYQGQMLLADAGGEDSGLHVSPHEALRVRAELADQPARLLSFYAAEHYCFEQQLRLPTEAEWEYAARGSQRRPYPWGWQSPTCEYAVFGRYPFGPCETDFKEPLRVDVKNQDVSEHGLLHLGGNVAEWVSDVFSERYPLCQDVCKDPIVFSQAGASASAVHVIRGGYYSARIEELRGAGRAQAVGTSLIKNVGFRCAADAPLSNAKTQRQMFMQESVQGKQR